MITSSEVVMRALRHVPEGISAKREGSCAACGAKIRVGSPYVPFSVSQSFTDELSLAVRGSDMLCGNCSYLLSNDGLKESGYGVFSESEGYMPFRKWADIAHLLTYPPEPPFVMVYATAKNQHMAWRAPVNLSRELFYVRVGMRDLKIRHRKLLKAVEACRYLAERAMPEGKAKTGKTLPNPFVSLSPDLKDISNGAIKWSVRNFVNGPDANEKDKAAFQDVIDLTQGEVWALRFLLTPGSI